jgi:hypothetical protein
MKLGEFIKNFSHNNIVRLMYKEKGGHGCVLEDWNDVSMDHEILNSRGKNRHYIDNEVLGLATICFRPGEGHHYPEALNIVIEELENQPFIEEIPRGENFSVAMPKERIPSVSDRVNGL